MNPNMERIINEAPDNLAIQNTLFNMDLKLDQYLHPACSISGGSDSDIMIDVIERVRGDRPVKYVFFDTGIEYEATKQHLDDLERRYGIEIIRRNAKVPVPLGCKQFGVPFLSKRVAMDIKRLQSHGFQWEDEPFEVLCKRYPDCSSALKWWCNRWELDNGKESKYNIKRLAYLKEFMIANPPNFPISDECCEGAKKSTARTIDEELDCDMKILGLRQAENGIRSTSLSNCFSPPGKDGGIAYFRPLWYWTDEDKALYKAHYGITYSDCYEVWGFKRTGCAGCPFNSRFDEEIKTIAQYEPRLSTAVQNIFGASYEYARAYREYRERRKEVEGQERWEDV